MVALIVFLGINYTFIEVLMTSHFTLLGFLVWSLIEYVIHKLDFHHNIFETKKFKGADLHHCFPTLPDTLSVSINSVTPKLLLFIVVFYFIIQPIEIALMLMGVVFGLLFYNIIHYNAHYGP
jgi:4-hydroxysphinganine ceramide fatty acyl 2-hydroxylase